MKSCQGAKYLHYFVAQREYLLAAFGSQPSTSRTQPWFGRLCTYATQNIGLIIIMIIRFSLDYKAVAKLLNNYNLWPQRSGDLIVVGRCFIATIYSVQLAVEK